MQTPRERLRLSLNHQEPDQVVVDLGSTAITGIAASALHRLRERLNLPSKTIRIHEPFQLLGFVDQDVVQALGCDVLGIWSAYDMFGYSNEKWKSWQLFDGTPVFISEELVFSEDSGGNIYLHPAGDSQNPPCAKLPQGGYYFDVLVRQNQKVPQGGKEDFAEQYSVYSDEECRFYEDQSRYLFENTDFGLIGMLSGGSLGDIAHVPGPNLAYPQGIRDPMDWYVAHKLNPEYIKDVFAYQTEIALKNAELYWQAVGSRIEAIVISGTDFGTQRSEFISPDTFRDLYKPFFQKINHWIHKNTTWKTFYHTCGSIVNLLDDLADCGVDILNPVQCSAAGMEPKFLKEKYGDRFVFWGGGVNTQHTLPFGNPNDVRDEVLERLQIFSPGGGYIFSAIHNIQAPTSVDNILAIFEAVNLFRKEQQSI